MTVPLSHLSYPPILKEITQRLSPALDTLTVTCRSPKEAIRLRTLFYGWRKALLRERDRLSANPNIKHLALLQSQYTDIESLASAAGAILCSPSGSLCTFSLASSRYTLQLPLPIPSGVAHSQPEPPPLVPLPLAPPPTSSIVDLFITPEELSRSDDPLNRVLPPIDDFPPDEEFSWR